MSDGNLLSWSQKTGQSAKVNSKLPKGYEYRDALEVRAKIGLLAVENELLSEGLKR